MTRSHDNAYSRVNECQSRATASNDANTLLGNKRKLPCVSFVCPTFFTARKENVALTSNENSSARIVASSDRKRRNVAQLSVDVASRRLCHFKVLLSRPANDPTVSAIFFREIHLATEEKTLSSRKIRLNLARYRSTVPQSRTRNRLHRLNRRNPTTRQRLQRVRLSRLLTVFAAGVVDLCPLSSFVFATTRAIDPSRKRTRNVGGIVFRIRVMSRPTRRRQFRDENR